MAITALDPRTALQVTQVVVVGIATSFGVESTARGAHDLGYHVTIPVTIPVDAVTVTVIESHETSATREFPALAETGTVDGALSALAATTA